MIYIHNISAFGVLIGGVLVAKAYLPMIRNVDRPVAARLMWGVALMIFGIVFRSNYWANARLVLGDYWPAVREAMGGLNANTMSDFIILIGVYMVISAKLYAIPLPERNRHNIITAINYPDASMFERVFRKIGKGE